jgi:hypothetical protein
MHLAIIILNYRTPKLVIDCLASLESEVKIDRDTVIVVDNASGPIETIPAGASGFVFLADNATVAGTWRRHAFLPASSANR